jgi:hypothetical protein
MAGTTSLEQKQPLDVHDQAVLVKVLQAWKLYLFSDTFLQGNRVGSTARNVAVCQMVLLTMALSATAMDSSQIGSSEVNKALEIELG